MGRKLLHKLITPEEFKELYINKNMSTLDLAELYNCHPSAILRLSKRYKIIKTKEARDKCMVAKVKKSKLEKYGVENNSQLPEWKEKVKKTCQERYGTDNVSQVKEFIEKRQKTCTEKYGVSNPMQVKEFERKSKSSCFRNNGYISPFEKEEVRNKAKQTMISLYGVDNPSKVLEFNEKRVQTYLENYGNKNNPNYLDLQERIQKTCLKKYGVPYNCMRPECVDSTGNTISKLNHKWFEFLEISNISVTFEKHINTKSYDILINNTRFLLEINPTSTHNSTINIFTKKAKNAKPKNYHYEKSKLATDNGYHCIHVWDWDDKDKIVNLFKHKERIPARKTQVKEISKKEADEFNNQYHLQNTCKGQQVCIGLYYNEDLVSLMTFGKPRYNKNYQWELLRYTIHSNYMIIGGAEKLFKYFITNYNPESIISYCDYSKFTGQVYQKLGFNLSYRTSPTCHWVKGSKRITQAQLSKYGFDKLLGNVFGYYGKGTDNQELMLKHGFVQVYDCGQMVFVWKG